MYRFLLKHIPTFVGLLFLASAALKLFNPGQATMALESLDIPYKQANIMVIVVTILEFYLGALLLKKIDLKYAMIASTVLMFLFTAYLWYLSTLANPPSCGCLGLTGIFNSKKVEAVFGLARNCAILWALKLSYDYYFKPSQSTGANVTMNISSRGAAE
jgi:uncharacterized membrane protein YphA (DoxX/SURF4 family)